MINNKDILKNDFHFNERINTKSVNNIIYGNIDFENYKEIQFPEFYNN